jgi:hypothetical protein
MDVEERVFESENTFSPALQVHSAAKCKIM